MIFDTHAHYDDRQFDTDRQAILAGLPGLGIGRIVDVSSDILSWARVCDLTRRYDFIYGAIGVHPDEVGALSEEAMLRMEQLLSEEKIVAVGEIGLDYHWNRESARIQLDWFDRQMDLAKRLDMPVIIHSREAARDTMDVIRRYAGEVKGVVHCYSYSSTQAMEYAEMGYMIGVGGVVTFKNARKLKETVEQLPLSAIVLETDCPYLAPTPHRGKRNDSGYLPLVAQEIARIKGVDMEQVIRQTWTNACRLYRLPASPGQNSDTQTGPVGKDRGTQPASSGPDGGRQHRGEEAGNV